MSTGLTESPTTPGSAAAATRRVGTAVGLVALAASFMVGVNLLGTRDALFGAATPAPRASAVGRVFQSVPAAPAPKTVLRSQPWWQTLNSFHGTGPSSTARVSVGAGAIQWRMRWSCTSGRFAVASSPNSKPLVDARCPAQNRTEVGARQRGPLEVSADGPWQLRVQQQVDVPLVEPPLPAMSAPGTVKVAGGDLYRIDQVGNGRLTIYRLPSGRHALRLQSFYVSPNVDLQIRLSPLRAPRSTRQYTRAPSAFVAPLDVTAGSLNFVLPARVDPSRYRSVVIWCPNIVSAYAAASLRPVR